MGDGKGKKHLVVEVGEAAVMFLLLRLLHMAQRCSCCWSTTAHLTALEAPANESRFIFCLSALAAVLQSVLLQIVHHSFGCGLN
jgi:hypothetical protein